MLHVQVVEVLQVGDVLGVQPVQVLNVLYVKLVGVRAGPFGLSVASGR